MWWPSEGSLKPGAYDPSVVVALTGARVEKPQYYKTIRGTEVAPLLEKQLKEGDNRVISGNVLNGKKIDPEKGYVGFFDSQVTVIRGRKLLRNVRMDASRI